MNRVLYFTRDYNTHDRRFLAALARTEHQVFYLQLELREPPLGVRDPPDGIEPVEWEGGRRPFNLEDVPRLSVDLERVIRQVQPDQRHAGSLGVAPASAIELDSFAFLGHLGSATITTPSAGA